MTRRTHINGIIRFATLSSIILNVLGWPWTTNQGSVSLFNQRITQNCLFSTCNRAREKGKLSMMFSGIVEEIGTVRDLNKHKVGVCGTECDSLGS